MFRLNMGLFVREESWSVKLTSKLSPHDGSRSLVELWRGRDPDGSAGGGAIEVHVQYTL